MKNARTAGLGVRDNKGRNETMKNNSISKNFFTTAVLVLAMMVAGCGGSDSSDGAGGGVQDSPNSTAVYSGTATLTVNNQGFVVSDTGSFTATITGNRITLTDGESRGSATINANGVDFRVPVTIMGAGVNCSNPIIAAGRISIQNVDGTFSGSATCTLDGITARLVFSGSFNTIRTSGARAVRGRNMSTSISEAFE